MPAKPSQTLHRIMLDSYTPTTWIYTPHTQNKSSTSEITYSTTISSFYSTVDTTVQTPEDNKHLSKIPPHLLPILKQQLKTKPLLAALDGSVSGKSLMAAWAIQINEHTLKTGGNIPLGSGKPSSTRAERGAFMHLLQNLTQIYTDNALTGGKLIVYIDNLQVINKSTLPKTETGPTKFLLDDYDLLQNIHHYKNKLEKEH